MTGMIERVARVLCDLDGHSADEFIPAEGVTRARLQMRWQVYAISARWVLIAMREPTAAMERAWGRGSPAAASARSDWQAMIDAALED